MIWLTVGTNVWLALVDVIMHIRVSNNGGISSVAQEVFGMELVTKILCR